MRSLFQRGPTPPAAAPLGALVRWLAKKFEELERALRRVLFSLHENVLDHGAAGDGEADDTAALQAAIDAAASYSLHTLASSGSAVYNVGRVLLPPRVYRTTAPLTCPQSVVLAGTGGPHSAVIFADHAGDALVVHSTVMAPYTAAPDEKLRSWRMENVAIHSDTATCGLRVGASSFRSVDVVGCQFRGIQGYAVELGEAVYMFGFRNSEVMYCDAGLYAGAYCDIVTITDRCFFTLNRGPDLVLCNPSAYIAGNDFEGADCANWADAAVPKCHVEIRQDSAVTAANRNLVLYGNRFGPEGAQTVDYDIALTRGDTSTTAFITDGVRIRDNYHHTANAVGQSTKIAPVLLDCPTNRLHIDGGYFNRTKYSSGYYVVSTSVADALPDAITTDNYVGNVLNVHPDVRGVFGRFGNPEYEQVICAAGTIPALSAVYYFNYSASEASGPRPRVAQLASSSIASNYSRYAGVALASNVAAERHAVIAKPGAIVDTALDASAGAFNDPVYIAVTTGALTLTAPAAPSIPLIVGRVQNVATNCKVMLVAPTIVGGTAITWSASMTPAALAGHQTITTLSGGAQTINAPSATAGQVPTDQELTITIRNTTAGAMGATTWDAVYKMAAWTAPATGQSRSITFRWNGTNWVEQSRTPADVPN